MSDRWAFVAIGDPPVLFERRPFTSDEFEAMGPLTIVAECAELFGGCVTDHTGDGRPHCWTHEQYVALSAAGILGDYERIELLEGEIVRMPPIGVRHAHVVDTLMAWMGELHRDHAFVRVQSSLLFNRVEVPRPDLVILRPQADRYCSRPAGPWDALLVAEVADSSLEIDRMAKAPRYARAAIPEYWIVDVNAPALIVHAEPVGGEYTNVRTYRARESFRSAALNGLLVNVNEAMGLPLPSE